MVTSYHNHTRWSDGKPTVAEVIAAARQFGLDEIGISDHYTLAPGWRVRWSMPLERLGDYVAELQQAAAAAEDTKVRIGIEADFFPETVGELGKILSLHPLDY